LQRQYSKHTKKSIEEGMITLNKNQTNKYNSQLALLRKRIEQNYADFRAEMLLHDEESIFINAERIAAVKNVHDQIVFYDTQYFEDVEEIEYLLKFYNPLEMIADFLQIIQAGYPVEVDEALMELFEAEDKEDYYLTIDFAEELIKKYGDDVRMEMVISLETIEVLERYIKLLRLSRSFDDLCDCNDTVTLFKPDTFDEDGFFFSEDGKEGRF
jgi:hypothetical protein